MHVAMASTERWIVVGCAALLAGSVLLRAQAPAPTATGFQPVDFVRDIQPILEKHCSECHGTGKARGRLRLFAPDVILKGGVSGPALVPGRSTESLLMHRVLGLGGDDRMPLDADPLPDTAVALLRTWIDQGATMPAGAATAAAANVEEHWAYVKPTRPGLPAVAEPAWVRTPVDRFVLARLEHETLRPSPEASRAALLRRVTLDLTGLPPSVAELDAFLADARADAYEAVVDRLLASPHYGERWARPWLDLARYADTNGHEKDNRRAIWKYRDWVIDALNRDMPFDQFTIEQIAGDMLPNATVEQQVASGFHRNAMTNEEGGVDPDESMYEVLVDRANTTATVWLGTTLGCAQCHNHKYDPFSQKDYFRLLAFFANTDYESRTAGDGTRYSEARLDLATPAQEALRKDAQAEIDRLDRELRTTTPAVRDAQQQWEQSLLAMERRWTRLVPGEVRATGGVVLTPLGDGSVRASGPNPAMTSYTFTSETSLQGITGLRLDALPDPSLPKGGPGRDGYGHFRVTGLHVEIAPVRRPALRGQAVVFSSVKVDGSARPFEPADLLSTAKPPADRPRGSWAVNSMAETERLPRRAVLAATAPFGFAEGTRITLRIDQLDGTIGQGIGRFQLMATTDPQPLLGADVAPRLRLVLAVPAAERSKAQADELAALFRSTTPLLAPARESLRAARQKLADLQIPSTLVMKERPTFERPSYDLRERGSFTARGARMYARTPVALPSMRDDLPANRLGLARWLTDEGNPLVARVAVNRLWEQLFGRGLVETSEDFGTQGAAPSHPELLDWLATELVTRKWSQKAIVRTIVTSATYRQSSSVTSQLVQRDPYNRLLARGPRFRMEAEMVRDVVLSASGLLSANMHGPSVYPVQPPGIWNMPYNTDTWTTSEGEDRYRRSLYTFWRRTSPYPSFMTFDATSREYCLARRVRTNTPLQALTLLNDPVAFDAARALAARMAAAGQTPADAVAHGVKLVLSRHAKPDEISRLTALYEAERRRYRSRGGDATRVAGTGRASAASAVDLAAWTIVANVLLNLDETVTKG